MSYAYMNVLESAPDRYDRGMHILTLGRLEQVHQAISDSVERGSRVLDIGCGTGSLAVRLAGKGVCVRGIDVSASMLAQASDRIRAGGLEALVSLQLMGAADLDTAFSDGSFDAVVATLVLSELSNEEIAYTLEQSRRILRAGGQLLVADEVMPETALRKVASFLVRLPFAVIAFLLTQNTTHRVARLRERIEKAGFKLVGSERFLAGSLVLHIAQKP
jgi:ubiquinone/menaquinone biosynthesis C-methylase UbiE